MSQHHADDGCLWTATLSLHEVAHAIVVFDAGKEQDGDVVVFVPCPECDGAGKVTEYISRTDYIATGGPDPVECAECKGSGWVEAEP